MNELPWASPDALGSAHDLSDPIPRPREATGHRDAPGKHGEVLAEVARIDAADAAEAEAWVEP